MSELDLRKLSELYLTDSERKKIDSGVYKLQLLCVIKDSPTWRYGFIGYRIGILVLPGLETKRDFIILVEE